MNFLQLTVKLTFCHDSLFIFKPWLGVSSSHQKGCVVVLKVGLYQIYIFLNIQDMIICPVVCYDNWDLELNNCLSLYIEQNTLNRNNQHDVYL